MTKLSARRDFLREELRRDGRRVTEGAVTALLDAVGSDLRELSSAAGQLLADTSGPVDEEVVVAEPAQGRIAGGADQLDGLGDEGGIGGRSGGIGHGGIIASRRCVPERSRSAYAPAAWAYSLPWRSMVIMSRDDLPPSRWPFHAVSSLPAGIRLSITP